MTQIFDDGDRRASSRSPSSRRGRARGPGQDRRDGRLRGRPARVRAGRRAEALEGRARAPREGAAPSRTATWSSSAAERVARRRDRDRRGLPARRQGQGRRASRSARASPGTIKRHSFHRGPKTHGSHNIRKPGSIGASATPSRVFKGIKMAGRMGGKRVTQVGLTVHEIDAEQNLAPDQGRRPRPEERDRRDPGAEGALMAKPKAPLLDPPARPRSRSRSRRACSASRSKPHLVHETVRAELNARRAGHARGEEPRPRLRRPREAVAPEGHRPRPPGHDPRPAVHGRRRRLPAHAARLRRSR